MLLGNLLKLTSQKYKDIPVEGIAFNSKEVKKNYIFFAIDGNKTSGKKFIKEAILKGASVIIANKKIKKKIKIPTVIVKDTRESLSEACSKFYKKKPLNIVAVTGTNGKSSVADFTNCAENRLAGTSTAAIFLKQFVGESSWVHIDIASTMENKSTKGYQVKGMNGSGTRTLIQAILTTS